MRKFLFTLLLLMVCHIGYGQSINSLFDEFSGERNAEYVKLSPFVMSLGKIFCKHDEDNKMMGKVKSIKVLDLEDCSASVKERFNLKVTKLKQKGYEELIRVNDEGEKVRIWMKMKKESIRELLIICAGEDDCALIRISGKFGKDDIDDLVNMETGKKHGRS